MAQLNYIEDVDFLKRILPVMRKDMVMLMSYQYTEEAPLDCPIMVFAGDKDEVVLFDQIKQWREQTTGHFSLDEVPGDHWFLSRNQVFILQRLTDSLRPVTADGLVAVTQ